MFRVFALLLLSVSIATAGPWRTPSERLQSKQAQLVIGHLSKVEGSQITLRDAEQKLGLDPMPQPVEIDLPLWAANQLEVGQRYWVAYTIFADNPIEKGAYFIDTRGAQVLQNEGLSPAVIRDDPLLHAWFEQGMDATKPEGRALLFQGLAHADPQIQHLFAGELRYHTRLPSSLSKKELNLLKRYLLDDRYHPFARACLLTVLHDAKTPDFDSLVARVLASAPLRGYSEPGVNQGMLISLTLDFVNQTKSKPEAGLLERLVLADNASISEFALLALRAQSAGLEQQALENALKQSLLAAETRQFLIDHQRRLASLVTATK